MTKNDGRRGMNITSCNLCGEKDFFKLVTAGKKDIFRCRHCKLLFSGDIKETARVRKFYESKYYSNEFSLQRDQTLGSRDMLYAGVLDRIERISKRGRLLDMGCGLGHFMKLAEEKGWEPCGIEISSDALCSAREDFQLKVMQADISGPPFKNESFDAVTIFNVLDLVPDPSRVLLEVRRILKNKGVLALRVANASFHVSLYRAFKRMGFLAERLNLYRFLIFHLYQFTGKTLRMILAKAGFEVTSIINSRPSRGDPYGIFRKLGGKGADFLKGWVHLFNQVFYLMSLRSMTLSPALEAYAIKKN